jgi:integrase
MKIPGTIFNNNGRWWWRVSLPGQSKRQCIPLKPEGARFATNDYELARQIAQGLYEATVLKPKNIEKNSTIRTVGDLVQKYLEHCRIYYQKSNESVNIEFALKSLLPYSLMDIEDMRPAILKEIRQKMIDLKRARSTINRRISMIKRMFAWGVEEELIPARIAEPLRYVRNLMQGRSEAKETEPVTPVAEKHVYATLPYTSPVVAAMIELQLITGMRSGELCIMRPCDIDTSGKIWYYTPSKHKTQHHGHKRIIALGPKAQQLLKPYLKRKIDSYCFSPAEALHLHKSYTPCRSDPKFIPGDRYDHSSYRRAIDYAIEAARKVGVKVPNWTPHQLRHTAATRIRKEMGLDAARAVLGHRHLAITDDYAEIDQALATTAAKKLG